MSSDLFTWAWLIGGAALIGLEVHFPHFYSLFFGAGAIMIALLRWIGLISDPIVCVVLWTIISTGLLLSLRHLAVKKFHSESSYQHTDEDIEALGQIVDVTTAIDSSNTQGRIRFRGTTWPATCGQGKIPAGKKAKVLFRDNLVWKVEPCPELDEPNDNEKIPPPVIRSGESS